MKTPKLGHQLSLGVALVGFGTVPQNPSSPAAPLQLGVWGCCGEEIPSELEECLDRDTRGGWHCTVRDMILKICLKSSVDAWLNLT